MAVIKSKKTQEKFFIELLKLLIEKFEDKKLEFDSYQRERFLEEVVTDGKWVDKKPTGWEEIRILFRPKKRVKPERMDSIVKGAEIGKPKE